MRDRRARGVGRRADGGEFVERRRGNNQKLDRLVESNAAHDERRAAERRRVERPARDADETLRAREQIARAVCILVCLADLKKQRFCRI